MEPTANGIDRLRRQVFVGAIALQVWSFAGDRDRKEVSMLMIKPFFYYTFAVDWDSLYVPYGLTVCWNKASGEKVYLPLGGGVQGAFTCALNDQTI